MNFKHGIVYYRSKIIIFKKDSTVKIIKATLLLMMFGSMNIYPMDLDLTLEQQLVDGNVSVAEYLRRIETNPLVWGLYSGMVQKLRTAEIASPDYRSGALDYQVLRNFVRTLVLSFNNKKQTRIIDELGEQQRGYIANLTELKIQILRMIQMCFDSLKNDKSLGLTVEGRST